MAIAKNLGLTDKVVSARHYWASQKKMTVGEAAAFISKKNKSKNLSKGSSYHLQGDITFRNGMASFWFL